MLTLRKYISRKLQHKTVNLKSQPYRQFTLRQKIDMSSSIREQTTFSIAGRALNMNDPSASASCDWVVTYLINKGSWNDRRKSKIRSYSAGEMVEMNLDRRTLDCWIDC